MDGYIRNAEEDVYEEAQKTRTIRNGAAEMTKHVRRGKNTRAEKKKHKQLHAAYQKNNMARQETEQQDNEIEEGTEGTSSTERQ